MKMTLIATLATLFAFSAVAIADETPGATAVPANTAATAGTTDSGSSHIVKHSAKKKKKKKKKHASMQ